MDSADVSSHPLLLASRRLAKAQESENSVVDALMAVSSGGAAAAMLRETV